jgi:hypothetical protein
MDKTLMEYFKIIIAFHNSERRFHLMCTKFFGFHTPG